jgi:hypothetical protein
MLKTSIGELKLSPIKENGKFVFYNDFITINGKISKGDRITIEVEGYEQSNGKYIIKPGKPSTFTLIVRGTTHQYTDTTGHTSLDDLYTYVSEQYKSQFYFGKKN